MHELLAKVGHLVAPALAGAFISWAGTSMTLVGRVDAMEKSQQRIEALMLQVLQNVGAGKGGK